MVIIEQPHKGGPEIWNYCIDCMRWQKEAFVVLYSLPRIKFMNRNYIMLHDALKKKY